MTESGESIAAENNTKSVTKKKSLGKWFPSASLIKSDISRYGAVDSTASKGNDALPITICLFYQYVRPLWSEGRRADVIRFIEAKAAAMNIGGRVRVALEGLNSTISGGRHDVRRFTAALGEMDSHFRSTDFKYIDELPVDRAFKDLKVLPVQELVYYGIPAAKELPPGGATQRFANE